MKREPLIHISQVNIGSAGTGILARNRRSVLVYALGLLFALILCGVILAMFTGLNPLTVYGSIVDGAFGTKRRSWETIRNIALMLCIGFSVLPAYRMRYWNTGAEGQVLIGACATAAVLIYGKSWPAWMLYIVGPAVAILAGMLWAVIPAFFRTRWGTNETLFTLMLNYIAMQVVSYCIVYWENPAGSNSVGLINGKTKAGWLPNVAGNSSLGIIIITAALLLFMFYYLNYTKHGFEISVVGGSERTAAYAGINVSHVIIRTMLLCGVMAGIAGYLLVAGVAHTISTTLVDNRGFTVIIVAWLGKLNPFGMLLISFLLVFMDRGASQIASEFSLNSDFADILIGVILFVILASEFFIHYTVHFRSGKARQEAKA